MPLYYHFALLLNNRYVVPDEIRVTMSAPPAMLHPKKYSRELAYSRE